MSNFKEQVGEWIRVRRDELGLSPAELAKRVGVSYRTVMGTEAGQSAVRANRARWEDVLEWERGALTRAYSSGESPVLIGKAKETSVGEANSSDEEYETLPSYYIDGDSNRINGLALLIQNKMKKLPGSRAGKHMSPADLARQTGLNVHTVYAYVKGDIQGARLNDAVIDKLTKIAEALDLPVNVLVAAARDARPDQEQRLMRLWRQFQGDTEREWVLMFLQGLITARRREEKVPKKGELP